MWKSTALGGMAAARRAASSTGAAAPWLERLERAFAPPHPAPPHPAPPPPVLDAARLAAAIPPSAVDFHICSVLSSSAVRAALSASGHAVGTDALKQAMWRCSSSISHKTEWGDGRMPDADGGTA